MILIVQAGLVASVLLWLVITQAPNMVWVAILCGAGALVVFGAGLAGIWVYPPLWLMVCLSIGGLVLVALWSWRRTRREKARGVLQSMLRFVGAPLWGIVGGMLVWQSLVGRVTPSGEMLDLATPLQGAGFCVISGGASPLLNFHMETLAPGKENYRGQSYGVDFIALSPLGLRTRDAHLFEAAPRDPRAYRIFGAEVRAPCAGEVMSTRADMADQAAGEPNLSAMPGNHVILRCERYDVLLAHLREGSVAVTVGERVAVGTRLGEVGNTGATDEPHLHLSVQRGVDTQPDLSGDPVHVTFGGEFLARGACLSH
jgi:hypothetical protein